jgi:gamma-glutamyl hercynylcysteine S-oxide synthase
MLATWVRDARLRAVEVVADFTDGQLMGPQLRVVNPLLWEIGHVTWFQEKWALLHAGGQAPVRADKRLALRFSSHSARQPLEPASAFARRHVCLHDDSARPRLQHIEQGNLTEQERYFIALGVFHEDMHTEAFTCLRQTHGWSPLVFSGLQAANSGERGPLHGDAEIPGGRFLLGALPEEPIVFDNEKWPHVVDVRPFAIARAAVTQSEFR